ncbi:MAG: M20/M25/M40 family metallo-hydrolase [Bermanella sp.]
MLKDYLAFACIALGMGMLLASQPASAIEHDAAITHLAQAIRFETVSHQQKEKIDYSAFNNFRSFLKSTYPIVFSSLSSQEISQHSLLIQWTGSNKTLKPVLFEAHYDVVPIEDGTMQDWQHPPFSGVIEDGYLWGRGSLDDKVSVITSLEAMEQLLKEGYTPERTLLFAFGHDEEIGGKQGAKKIAEYLKQKNIELEYVIGEGGLIINDHPILPTSTVAMIALAEKSYLTLTLNAKGEGGHSSAPSQNSAVIRLAKAVSALDDNPFEAKLVSPVSEMLLAFAPHVGAVESFLFRNQWLSEPLLVSKLSEKRMSNPLVRTTTAVTMFNAGVKENVVSQQAHAKVNFRLLPGDTSEQVLARVTELINDTSIEITADSWGDSPKVANMNAEGYRRIQESIESELPDTIVTPGLLMATTDTRHYTQLTDNIYRFQPFTMHMDDSKTIHSTNERVSLEAIVNAVAISRQLLTRVAKP